MGMSDIDIGITRSPEMSFLLHEINQLKKFIKDNLEMKSCSSCNEQVLASEFHIIYDETRSGVCNKCYMEHYLPFTKPFDRETTGDFV